MDSPPYLPFNFSPSSVDSSAMSSSSPTHAKVAIFWDLDGEAIPPIGMGISEGSEALRQFAHEFGDLCEFKAYISPASEGELAQSARLASDLRQNGVALSLHHPNSDPNSAYVGPKEHVLISDILIFALDHGPPGRNSGVLTLILVTNDYSSLGYPLSLLRNRHAQIIVLSTREARGQPRYVRRLDAVWNSGADLERIAGPRTSSSRATSPPRLSQSSRIIRSPQSLAAYRGRGNSFRAPYPQSQQQTPGLPNITSVLGGSSLMYPTNGTSVSDSTASSITSHSTSLIDTLPPFGNLMSAPSANEESIPPLNLNGYGSPGLRGSYGSAFGGLGNLAHNGGDGSRSVSLSRSASESGAGSVTTPPRTDPGNNDTGSGSNHTARADSSARLQMSPGRNATHGSLQSSLSRLITTSLSPPLIQNPSPTQTPQQQHRPQVDFPTRHESESQTPQQRTPPTQAQAQDENFSNESNEIQNGAHLHDSPELLHAQKTGDEPFQAQVPPTKTTSPAPPPAPAPIAIPDFLKYDNDQSDYPATVTATPTSPWSFHSNLNTNRIPPRQLPQPTFSAQLTDLDSVSQRSPSIRSKSPSISTVTTNMWLHGMGGNGTTTYGGSVMDDSINPPKYGVGNNDDEDPLGLSTSLAFGDQDDQSVYQTASQRTASSRPEPHAFSFSNRPPTLSEPRFMKNGMGNASVDSAPSPFPAGPGWGAASVHSAQTSRYNGTSAYASDITPIGVISELKNFESSFPNFPRLSGGHTPGSSAASSIVSTNMPYPSGGASSVASNHPQMGGPAPAHFHSRSNSFSSALLHSPVRSAHLSTNGSLSSLNSMSAPSGSITPIGPPAHGHGSSQLRTPPPPLRPVHSRSSSLSTNSFRTQSPITPRTPGYGPIGGGTVGPLLSHHHGPSGAGFPTVQIPPGPPQYIPVPPNPSFPNLSSISSAMPSPITGGWGSGASAPPSALPMLPAVSFHPLIRVLEKFRSHGQNAPLRSAVGSELRQSDPHIYDKLGRESGSAGASGGGIRTFKEYASAAERMGLVVLIAGSPGKEKISLVK